MKPTSASAVSRMLGKKGHRAAIDRGMVTVFNHPGGALVAVKTRTGYHRLIEKTLADGGYRFQHAESSPMMARIVVTGREG